MSASMRQSNPSGRPPTQSLDPLLDNIVLVDNLPSDAWAEGIVVRPCGQVLATRIDGCELYSIESAPSTPDPEASSSPPRTLLTFPNANCILGICQLTGTKTEDYAVLSCFSEFASAHFANARVWRVSFDPDDDDATPAVTVIADLPDAGFCLGIITISDTTLAIADTTKHSILRIHIPTAEASTIIEDFDTMGATVEGSLFGVNRIRVAGGYLWYTNTSTGKLYRAPIDHVNAGQDIRVTGPPSLVAEDFDHADGLVMTKDGTVAYVASYVQGAVWKVHIDLATGTGMSTTLKSDLITPTAMDLVYKDSEEKPTLYVICCGAVTEGFLEGDRGTGLTRANVDTSKLPIVVTITTDIRITYEPADAAA